MKVFVVSESLPYEGDTAMGAFSTQEKADAYANRKQREGGSYSQWLVTAFEVDKEQD